MSPMTTQRKILMIIGLAAGALLLVYFLIIQPSIKEMLDISQQITLQRSQLEQKYQQAQHLKQFNFDLKTIKPLIPELTKFFIIPGDELEFVTSLERIAQKYGINQQINMETNNPAGGQNTLTTTPVILELQGNFAQIIKYLDELERLNYYINLNTLIFQTNDYFKTASVKPSQTNGSNNINVHLEGSIFWQNQPPPLLK